MDSALVAQNERSGHIIDMDKISEVLPIALDDQRLTMLEAIYKLSRDNGVSTLRWVSRSVNHEEAQ